MLNLVKSVLLRNPSCVVVAFWNVMLRFPFPVSGLVTVTPALPVVLRPMLVMLLLPRAVMLAIRLAAAAL